MEKDILIVAHFCSDFDGKGNNRFNYLANLITKNNMNVELVTSDFSHIKKTKRDKNILETRKYKVTLIEEPTYKKNISLRRFYSHYVFAKNLNKYLKIRKKPNVIYCSVPSLDVAEVTARYAKKNNIKFIIDIQDIWPEAFKMVFNYPIISNIIYYPMKKKADYVYRSADEIIAVSETYAQRALKVNKKINEAHSVFLGTELSYFDNLVKENRIYNKPKDEIWIAYIGTLGHSYDITCVLNSLKWLQDQGINNLKFIVMGDGPLRQKFENYSKKINVNVEFKGRLDYSKMVGLLSKCDIAMNPISKGAAQSIINKVGDYAAAGLPVVNTQENSEYKNLMNRYKAGFNCINNDSVDVANKLLLLIENSTIRQEMGLNNRRLAEEKFDRKKTYQKIIELLI